MLERLPAHDSMVLYVDFAALRRQGILKLLEGSKAESEYLDFVRRSGFDYSKDLDAVMAVFRSTGKFFVVKGRFDWPKLRAYAEQQGGNCAGSVCRVAGSAPERKISFYPLRDGVMAMAVSRDDSAALQVTTSPQAELPTAQIPPEPLWVALPPAALRANADLPSGTRMFARALGDAESVVLAFGPDGQRMAAKLTVRCRNAQDASAVAGQLQAITQLLRGMIQREAHKPNPRDLSGVLASGTFRSEGERVYAYWPIERAFLEEILGGAS